MTDNDQRDALRARIEAAEERNARRFADYARDAGETASDFVRAHPLASIAAVAVIGITIGAMTRPGRRLGQRLGVLATYAAEFGLAHASGLLDSAGETARTGKERLGDKFDDISDAVGDSARKLTREAARQGSKGAAAARTLARGAAESAERSARDLRARLKR